MPAKASQSRRARTHRQTDGRATLDELYPRGPRDDRRSRCSRSPGSCRAPRAGVVHAASRRDLRHRRTARRRPHASAARDCSASSAVKRRSGEAGRPLWSVHAGRLRGRAGMGMLSEDRAGEGLALEPERRRQHDADQPRGPRPGIFRLAVAPATAARASGSSASASEPTVRRSACRELSGGNQQKVALARLLHHDVDVLVLDEPTRGIDVASKAQIYKLLDELVPTRTGPIGARQIRAHRQQVFSRAARALRSHRRDVARPPGRSAPRVRMDRARAADGGVRELPASVAASRRAARRA